MTKADAIASVARAAKFPTLEVRGSDRLDFREISVWQMRAALGAAYEAGYRAGALAKPAKEKKCA